MTPKTWHKEHKLSDARKLSRHCNVIHLCERQPVSSSLHRRHIRYERTNDQRDAKTYNIAEDRKPYRTVVFEARVLNACRL